MSDERKGRLLEEFAIMESIRIDNLNKNGYGATNKFRNARKMHEEIIQLIVQQKPKIDDMEKYVEGKACEIYNLSYYKSFKPEEIGKILTQIVSDVRGGKT